MRVLIVHNFYQQPGGEDQVFAAETDLLRERGHTVSHFTVHNDAIVGLSSATLARKTLWNGEAADQLRALCRSQRPQVVHFHNTFPLVSPAAYYAARSEGAAVVHTLHNFRLLCPGTTFYREGKVCEACLGKAVPWPAVRHACYRGSITASLGVVAHNTVHRAIGTWNRAVDMYIAPTEFLRDKFVQGGLPAERIAVKPHFLVVDPGVGQHRGDFALYVGRLVEEKGVRTLLEAWSTGSPGVPLKVVGDGPLASLFGAEIPGVEWLGRRSRVEVTRLMQEARFLVFPSEWYEAFGLTILEAFATGAPVIAARLGAAAELVRDRETGLHFDAGRPTDLLAAVAWARDHAAEMEEMGRRARQEYLNRYTAETNYHRLMAVYDAALKRRPAGAIVPERAPAAQAG